MRNKKYRQKFLLILASNYHRKIRLCLSILLFFLIFLYACRTDRGRIIFLPDPEIYNNIEQNRRNESFEIIETQNGIGDSGIPQWVYYCLNGDINAIESMAQFNNKYVFIGESRGVNFSMLQQWADLFSVIHELPKIMVLRVEQRLIRAASRYPDDEYGEFYEAFIKRVANETFYAAQEEESFWIKKKITYIGEEDPEDPELPPPVIEFERYEYYKLISVNKDILQNQIRSLMNSVASSVLIMREHSAAVNKIQSDFFEGF